MVRRPSSSTLFPYTTLFRSVARTVVLGHVHVLGARTKIGEGYAAERRRGRGKTAGDIHIARGVHGDPIAVFIIRAAGAFGDRKSTRLNSSHITISYAVFCLK